MLALAEAFTKSQLLMSIHLNDNGINKDFGYFKQMLAFFDLNLNDVTANRIEQIDPALKHEEIAQKRVLL
jgi:hypothetical protein